MKRIAERVPVLMDSFRVLINDAVASETSANTFVPVVIVYKSCIDDDELVRDLCLNDVE